MPIYKVFKCEGGSPDKLECQVSTDAELDHNSLKLKSIQDLAARQRYLADTLETIKRVSSLLQAEYDAIRLGILPEKMDEEDISNITIVGVGRVTIQPDLYFSIPATLREEAYNWLRDHNHGDLIQETVNSSSGKAWAKEMIKKGENLPEDLFKVTPFSRAQITKEKK
jgi:hypothetical protein